jgi:DNA repair and recombination RAD54-like protein
VERHFSSEGLRQLFELNTDTLCDTHDTFSCKRCVGGKQVKGPGAGGAGASANDTSTWNHYSSLELDKVHDDGILLCGVNGF